MRITEGNVSLSHACLPSTLELSNYFELDYNFGSFKKRLLSQTFLFNLCTQVFWYKLKRIILYFQAKKNFTRRDDSLH